MKYIRRKRKQQFTTEEHVYEKYLRTVRQFIFITELKILCASNNLGAHIPIVHETINQGQQYNSHNGALASVHGRMTVAMDSEYEILVVIN